MCTQPTLHRYLLRTLFHRTHAAVVWFCSRPHELNERPAGQIKPANELILACGTICKYYYNWPARKIARTNITLQAPQYIASALCASKKGEYATVQQAHIFTIQQ